MHSRRMRTARGSSRWGVCLKTPHGVWAKRLTRVWTWRLAQARPLNFPQVWARHAGIPPPPPRRAAARHAG